ncbi:MAG TPA: hypothetical protein DCZ94_18795 [Lentisphaeria bacterium]|nr:MAG: hypothetical protein A2X48_22100 [Lentisphaerae bacterium GWF2_49_21]HBC88992.1 hypothetical protein [Lentisphaeria bacterium]
MNKFIALDIGNVCLKLRFERCFYALGCAGDERHSDRILRLAERLGRGEISECEWIKCMHRETREQFSDKEILENWNLILGDEIPGMHELLGEMRELGYEIIFFSDTSSIHISRIFDYLKLTDCVAGGIYSYKVGASKPERKMYEAFEIKYGRPFLYSDDREENIEAGIRSGWFSHLFTSVDLLRKTFMERHVSSLI